VIFVSNLKIGPNADLVHPFSSEKSFAFFGIHPSTLVLGLKLGRNAEQKFILSKVNNEWIMRSTPVNIETFTDENEQ
jgi:hypothetical protein